MVRLALGFLCIALAVLVPVSSLATQGTPPARDLPKQHAAAETVYVTKTGEKYHRAGCRSLAKSAIPLALSEAAQRYGACKVCRPPTLGATGAPAPVPAASTPTAAPGSPAAAATTQTPAPRSKAQRCAATTKKGTQCSRTARAGSAFCWQHGR